MKMMFHTIIDGIKTVVCFLKTGEDNAFFAVLINEYHETSYAVGQYDAEDYMYQMSIFHEAYAYNILTGQMDWQDDCLWSGKLESQREIGYFQPLILQD